jgi:hypothetical protein
MLQSFKGEKMDDYAMPTMMAENALKALHWAACKRQYDEALDEAWKAMEACKDVYRALAKMKERDKE